MVYENLEWSSKYVGDTVDLPRGLLIYAVAWVNCSRTALILVTLAVYGEQMVCKIRYVPWVSSVVEV